MRILTVRQPWAWAIVHGGKDVENRGRNIAGSYRGPVAIHAGMREDTAARQHPGIQKLAEERWGTTADELLTGRHDQFGRIIGVVDLVDVHHAAECVYVGAAVEDFDGNFVSQEISYCSVWAQDSNVNHLVFANPRALDEPIPHRGALGLRKSEFEVAGDWLVERTETCTCGVGPSLSALYGHEPGCGYEPVARLVAAS